MHASRAGQLITVAKSLPTPGDVHVNQPLTNFSLSFSQDQEDFAAGFVFPTVPSDKQSNLYYVIPRDSWLRATMQERPRGTESAGGGWEQSNAPFYCKTYALHKDISDQDRANQDSPAVNLDRSATAYLTEQALIRRELDMQTAAFQPGLWSTDVNITANSGIPWNAAGASPIKTIRKYLFQVKQSTGKWPNALVLGATVWEGLQDAADFTSRIAFGNPNAPTIVTQELLQQVLGIKKVVVTSGIYNAADVGQPLSTQYIVGNSALLIYSDPNPTLDSASAGLGFAWTGLYGANADGGRIKTIRMEAIESDRVELSMSYAMQIISPDLGVYFYNCVQ